MKVCVIKLYFFLSLLYTRYHLLAVSRRTSARWQGGFRCFFFHIFFYSSIKSSLDSSSCVSWNSSRIHVRLIIVFIRRRRVMSQSPRDAAGISLERRIFLLCVSWQVFRILFRSLEMFDKNFVRRFHACVACFDGLLLHQRKNVRRPETRNTSRRHIAVSSGSRIPFGQFHFYICELRWVNERLTF